MKFVKNLLYSLKRRYGTSGDYYRVGATTTNMETGVASTQKTKIHIKRMIILPTKLDGNMKIVGAYSEKLTRALPGVSNELTTTFIIIDKKDLPKDFRSSLGDYLVVNSKKRFNIQKVEELEDNTSLLITALFIVDGILNVIYDSNVKIKETLTLNENPTN